MKLCLRPFDWVLLRRWCVRAGDRLPHDDSARAAFLAHRAVDRPAGLVTDPLEAVRLFSDVYRALARELSEDLPVAGAVDSLPTFKAGHTAGAAVVLGRTRRIVVLDSLQRAAHRHALAAGTWELEMQSWRARGRCARDRGARHDLRRRLDRPLTAFRHFALHGAYSLCPKCGLRNFARPFRWPVEASLSDADAYLRRLPEKGVSLSCRMHEASRHDYAVPDGYVVDLGVASSSMDVLAAVQ